MLSIQVLKGSAGDLSGYLSKESGEMDYWAKDAQSSASWHGQGAKELGLDGAVTQERFEQIMSRKLPDGTQLPEGRLGYDLTFSADKSVSLAGLVGSDSAVIAAHDTAVRSALDWLEQNTSQTQIKLPPKERQERGIEVERVQTNNITAAVFRHETSRDHDPQLHSHAVVANLTLTADGKWRALEPSEIYKNKMLAGSIYRAELAHNLQEIGYQVEQTTTQGLFQITGFKENQLEAFSTRSQAIKATGATTAREKEVAALATRHAKEALDDAGKAALRTQWQERARSLGVDFESVRGQNGHILDAAQTQLAADKSVRFAVEHLTERSSVIEMHHVMRDAMQRGVGFVRIGDIDQAVDRALATRSLVQLQDGRLSTPKALKRELQTLRAYEAGKGMGSAIQPDTERLTALAEGLNQGQAMAAKLILTSPDRIVGVQGVAGSGKTYMLNRVASEAAAQGFEVKAIAPTASAAHTLADEIGAEKGTTLAGHLRARPPKPTIGKDGKTIAPPQQLWIVDEAGLASTGQMRQLLLQAEKQDARIALVGDTKQMQAVEAGNPFRLLQEKGMTTAMMDEGMRHKNQQLKEVVELIREGESEKAVAMMANSTEGASISWIEAPEITEGMRPDEALEQLRQARLEASVGAFMDARQSGDALLIAEQRIDRAALNQMVRERLIEGSEIEEGGVKATTLSSNNLTRAEARLAQAYEPGDVIEFGRTYKSLEIQKGEVLTVKDIDYAKGRVMLERADGEAVEWNPARASRAGAYTVERTDLAPGDTIAWTKNDRNLERVNGDLAKVTSIDVQARTATVQFGKDKEQVLDLSKHQHLDHAHATTIYKSQGRTTDHVIIAGDVSGKESAYVAASRAKHSATMIAEQKTELQAQAARGEPSGKPTRGMENWASDIISDAEKAGNPFPAKELPDMEDIHSVRKFLDEHAEYSLGAFGALKETEGINVDEKVARDAGRIANAFGHERQSLNAMPKLGGAREEKLDAKVSAKAAADRAVHPVKVQVQVVRADLRQARAIADRAAKQASKQTVKQMGSAIRRVGKAGARQVARATGMGSLLPAIRVAKIAKTISRSMEGAER